MLAQGWIDMNERIKELAELSGFKVDWQHEDVQALKMARFEKFAELIVRECMEVVINGQYSASECHGNSHRISYNNGRTGASSDIKKHFGVEE